MQEIVVKLRFCTLSFYDEYVIAKINEGVHLDHDHNEVLIKVIEDHYSKPFVYITHRENSYSVDPNVYPRATKVEYLKGFAVVSNKYQAKINAQIEKMFFGKPFEIFANINDAVNWAKELIAKG
ncbi:hypothetical protein BWZ20_02965 [Winogradskyella sp. J14-2]|uniref:hypothetical protein n=1 Tax=Winogradskyella sp. J14-2 TaxID=1936080 RepID=UPI000972886F|nr:hypothetical protein [Winogradskyella sp. J14-2]APY07322.1 hypothetical protein BWZ20_02965 [Winogradskyella sp. J14-2]